MSAWVMCPCGKQKLVEFTPEEGAEYYCNQRCQKKYTQQEHLGPKPNVGSRSTTARSKRDARILDKLIGGWVVPGSGAVKGLDGDRITKQTMIEEKLTAHASYKLKLHDWEKLIGEAGRAGKYSALVLNMCGHRIVMMPLDEALERLEGEL